MKITKNKYLVGFTVIVLLLAIVRLIIPSVAQSRSSSMVNDSVDVSVNEESMDVSNKLATLGDGESQEDFKRTKFFSSDGKPLKTRIMSVPGFSKTFPDNNDVQLIAADRYGVSPVQNRTDAEHRKKELVYMGVNPYYHVDKLRNSIPYLVPRAAILLREIGRAYYDSLQMKGIPLHQIIVTSVLRTREDVEKLRGHNGNATQNSCHLYGTTFDICYNRYKTVYDPEGKERRAVRNDSLKWVLSEVLRDMRDMKRCYIKYEVNQGCFHITVR